MPRRPFAPLFVVSMVAALSTGAFFSSAAENFACGPGGTPDPKTSKCVCPAGRIEKTSGGTSRCVDRPVSPKPSATPSPVPTPTITPTPTPTITTDPSTSTTTPPPVATGTVDISAPTTATVAKPMEVETAPAVEQPPPKPGSDLGYVPISRPPTSEQPLEPRRFKAPQNDLHTYLETRIGMATMLQKSGGYGPSIDLSYGMGFSWVDIGIVGRFASIPVKDTDASARQFSIGPEIATRTSLGGGMTFRLGAMPLYTLETFNGSNHSLVGVDALAQFLFTIDDTTRPVWRLGVGFHGGRRWATAGGDGIWMVGADVIVRTWW